MIWAAALVLTGFAGGLASLVLARVMPGIGEGATFPTAARAMQNWRAAGRRCFAPGNPHAFARLGNAVALPVVPSSSSSSTGRLGFVVPGVANSPG